MNANLKTPKATQNFYGRDFYVTKDVLTPRPETEQLIDFALSLAGKPFLPGVKPGKRVLPKNPKIYDIGTGSGCIAITIKKELPEAVVVASDISKPALEIAKINQQAFYLHIPFIISNLLDFVKHDLFPTPDLVVANLPYVDKNWPWLDREALSSDPDIALYAENDGLELIFRLIDEAAELKIPRLLLEADPCEHSRLKAYAAKKAYELKEVRGFILYLEKA